MIIGPTQAQATASGSTASEYSARYEALRRHVIEHSLTTARDGLAVLLRQGVVAWVQALSQLPAWPPRPPQKEPTQPWPLADGASAEVVRVLAAMTLEHIQEVHS